MCPLLTAHYYDWVSVVNSTFPALVKADRAAIVEALLSDQTVVELATELGLAEDTDFAVWLATIPELQQAQLKAEVANALEAGGAVYFDAADSGEPDVWDISVRSLADDGDPAAGVLVSVLGPYESDRGVAS